MQSLELINQVSEYGEYPVYVKLKGKYYTIKKITHEQSELLSDTCMTILELNEEGV